MSTTYSKAKLKRAAVMLLERHAEANTIPEQRIVLMAMKLAIREIGSTYNDSTRYFFTKLFRLHCEGLGIDADCLRGCLISCGLLPPIERRMAA